MENTMDTYSDLDSDSEDPDIINDHFNSAAKHLESLMSSAKPSNEALLSLYALYKVATVGKCNTPRPNWYDIQGKKKWDMWHQMGDLSQTEAKTKYIRLIERLDSTWSPGKKNEAKSDGWVNVSSMINPNSEINDSEKTIFDFVRDGNIDHVRDLLKTLPDGNIVDDEGLGLIHWACDRGNDEMLSVLLESHVNVNLQAADGQTGLHYAASCGHAACVELLLRHKADIHLKDNEDATAKDIASDTTILNLLENYDNE